MSLTINNSQDKFELEKRYHNCFCKGTDFQSNHFETVYLTFTLSRVESGL